MFYAIKCHWEAFSLIKEKKVLFLWALLRFIVLLFLIIACSWFIFSYNNALLNHIWAKPSTVFMLILWKAVLILLTMILLVVGAIISYILSQLFFGIVIADHMSAITEELLTGKVSGRHSPLSLAYFGYLVKQEIPRGVFPLLISAAIMIIGWILPFNFIWVCVSSLVSSSFMAWDYTDLIPARMALPFGERLNIFKKTFIQHMVMGLPFLIPLLNIVFLSIGPVSGSIFFIRNLGNKGGSYGLGK